MIYNIGSFCDWSVKIIKAAQDIFNKDEFVTSHALPRIFILFLHNYKRICLYIGNEFEVNMKPLIDDFKQRTEQNILISLIIVRLLVISSGTQSGNKYQSFQVNDSWLIQRYSPAPSTLFDCTCGVSFDCPKIDGYFICKHGNNCTAGTNVWNVPGMVKSCTEMDTLMNMDLRCFYNQTCLNLVRSLYNVDIPTRLPLSAETLAIPPLNKSIPSQFSMSETVGTLFNHIMVEEWKIESSFEDYYSNCAPITCTYTFNKRLDIFYVIATVTGLIGGLLVAFRLLIPSATIFIEWIVIQCNNRHVNNHENNLDGERSRKINSLKLIMIRIKERILKYNLFKKESSITQIENPYEMSIIATRFYLIFLTGGIFILLTFNSLNYVRRSVTVKNPSLSSFEDLYNIYSTTLLCPCEQISIPYKTFLSLKATYHQVNKKILNINYIKFFLRYAQVHLLVQHGLHHYMVMVLQLIIIHDWIDLFLVNNIK